MSQAVGAGRRPLWLPDQTVEWVNPVSKTLPVSVRGIDRRRQAQQRSSVEPLPEEDRPPACPRCHKRLVILSSHWSRTPAGTTIRRQFWGCPRGHAAAYRTNGVFGPVHEYSDIPD